MRPSPSRWRRPELRRGEHEQKRAEVQNHHDRGRLDCVSRKAGYSLQLCTHRVALTADAALHIQQRHHHASHLCTPELLHPLLVPEQVILADRLGYLGERGQEVRLRHGRGLELLTVLHQRLLDLQALVSNGGVQPAKDASAQVSPSASLFWSSSPGAPSSSPPPSRVERSSWRRRDTRWRYPHRCTPPWPWKESAIHISFTVVIQSASVLESA